MPVAHATDYMEKSKLASGIPVDHVNNKPLKHDGFEKTVP
jgi:hypothetical protein